MKSISRNAQIDKLKYIVKECANTYHNTIKMNLSQAYIPVASVPLASDTFTTCCCYMKQTFFT